MQESAAPSPLAVGHPASAEADSAATLSTEQYLRPPLRLSNAADRKDGSNSDDQKSRGTPMNRKLLAAAFATSALCSPFAATAALAQEASDATQLGEVVVTATRREDTVHNIPLSVTAVTPQQLVRQGIKTAQDVSRIVPAVRIGQTNGGNAGGSTGNVDVAIRGIRSTVGSPTTGLYIDDIPIMQRNLNGQAGGGAALPQLFDLQRVEVLRGPQGTLFGGSSEGGTIRFITAQPSLTKRSVYGTAEASHTQNGDTNYEFGLATGGPIIQDKVGFRISGWMRHDAGYLDHVSRFSGNTIAENTNSANHSIFQATLVLKPTERSTITLGYLRLQDKWRDTDNFWEDFPQYTADVGPVGAPRVFTYGPYSFGPYKTGQNTNIGDLFYTSDSQLKPLYSPHSARYELPSVVLDYAFDKMNVKLVSALGETKNDSTPDYSFVDVISRGGTGIQGPFNRFANSAFIANLPIYSSVYNSKGKTQNLTEELRFSSNDPDSRLSWVAGVFFNRTKLSSQATIIANLADIGAAALNGVSQITAPSTVYSTPQVLNETQLAAFGEATYKITEKLRATAGVRVTRNEFKYTYYQGGSLFGLPLNPLTVAINGSTTESPVTPKFGLQYVFDQNTNVYFTAAKGFRPGGVNAVLPPACQPSLIAAGFPNGGPTTYDSDSLWSYEGGAKMRGLGGRATINASVYRIDWKNVQTPINLACGNSFTTSAAKVLSQGGDIQAQVRVFDGLTLSASIAYTDSKYTKTVSSSPTTILINDGDRVPFTPKWSGSIAAEYTFNVASLPAYIRGDFQFQSGVVLGLGPGAASHSPDNYRLPGNQYASLRAGVMFKEFEISVFANNVTNSKDILTRNGIASGPGRVTCLTAACTGQGTGYVKYAVGAVDTTFRPRTMGVNITYRY
jgi:outer membrane receptor protein involved in Fe transport